MEWIVEAETLSDFIDHGRYTIASKPLIRCKDCKYSHDEYGDGDCYCKRPGRTMDWFGQRWDYYCGDAKRRTDDDP